MKSIPTSHKSMSKTGLELYRAQLLHRMPGQPDDTREAQLDHFAAQVSAAFDKGEPASGLADELESKIQAWDLSGDCGLHSDSTQLGYTLAPHFLIEMSSDSVEDQSGGALVTISIMAAVDNAPHGDPCRQRAALDELLDILIAEFGAQAIEEPNLDWGTVAVSAPSADFDELSQWPAHLRELGWDVEASGDNMREDEA